MDLNESIKRILAEGTKLTDRFYEMFFERHPGARTLFDKTDMDIQSVMLSAALLVHKEHTDHPLVTRRYLNELGKRHARKGVPRELFPAFQEVLFVALAEFHGKDWTEELAREWRETMENVMQVMFEGYDHHSHV